ncbi:MAG: ABC transporter ATP-binding protein [Desulfobacula sp.]|jgi:branched-chain amino acid transport system ATP-binding protein|nr:ABC transporter ATP-binding protein [Desulfobacula sp.]MBT6338974.1 ABC transporter ATP-binding protein [Desulfobacula sp.]
MNEAILQLKDIHSHIGSHHILQGVSLTIKKGVPTTILGRNGAGKTSTLRTIMGLNPLTSGDITFLGDSIGGKKPYEIARKGIGFVSENKVVLSELTVEENFRLAMINESEKSWQLMEKVWELFPDIKKFWKAKAGNLSGGQKQMVSIARSFVDERPLLLIDEPAKGLAPIIVDHLGEVLKQIKDKTTVVLVEQNFHMASLVGEQYFILDDGRTVHQGKMEDLVLNEEVKKKYLGIG